MATSKGSWVGPDGGSEADRAAEAAATSAAAALTSENNSAQNVVVTGEKVLQAEAARDATLAALAESPSAAALAANLASGFRTAKIAYLSPDGDDSTGSVGLPYRPFRQIDAALAALATIPGPVVIEVLGGTALDYLPATTDDKPGSLLRDNLTLRCSQRGRFNNNLTAITQIAIPGPFIVNSNIRSGFGWHELGCDSGKAVTDAYHGGVAKDALVVANLDFASGIVGLQAANIVRPVCLCRDDDSAVHALLVESTSGATVVDPLTCYGLHGGVSKSTNIKWRGGRHYRNNGEAFIIKAEGYASCDNGQYDDISFGGSPEGATPWYTSTDQVGIKINPQGANLANHQFGAVNGREVIFGVRFQLGGYTAQNVSFRDVSLSSIAYTGLLIDGAGSVVDLSMTRLRLVDSTAQGIAVDAVAQLVRCRVGTLSMLNSGDAIDMSLSAQDLSVDLVQVRSILPGKYVYHLGSGRLRIGREDIEAGSLAQKWHPSSAPTYASGWVTQVSSATVPTVNLEGYGVALYGRAGNTGSSTRILSMHVTLVPGTPDGSMRTVVRGQLSGGGGTPCTVGLVVGIAGGLCVVDIETINGSAVVSSSTLTWVELTGVRWAF